MKIRLTILFLAIAVIGFAQKKEMKKIESAVSKNQMEKAIEIFETIDEGSVEEQYLGQYKFYKAAQLIRIGAKGGEMPSVEDSFKALDYLESSKELGYENEIISGQLSNHINQTLLKLANNKLTENDSKAALLIINKLSDKSPEDLNMLFNSANLAYQVGEFPQALEKYNKLYKSGFTGQSDEYIATSLTTKEEEKFPSKTLRDSAVKAGTHVKPIVSKSPSQLGTIVTNLVWLNKNNDNIEESKRIFESALKTYPDDLSLKVAKADNYLILEMMDEYKKASLELSKEVKDPAIYDNLALAAIKAKEYDNAIKYYKKSLELKSDNFNSLSNLGVAYVEKGNLESTTAEEQLELYKSAIDVYERALKIKDTNKDMINTLISLYGVFSMDDKAAALKTKL